MCGPQLMCGVLLDAADQIARHGLRQPARSGPACARASAVCARKTAAWPAELPPPTTITSSPRAQLRLDVGRAVVDAGALELREVRQGQAAGTRRRVAMMTVRAGTGGPSSISSGIGLAVAGEPPGALRDQQSGRRTSAPAYRPAPRAPAPRCRWESRGSSRSSSSSPPGRPARSPPAPGRRALPTRRRRRPPAPRARRRRRPGRGPASDRSAR